MDQRSADSTPTFWAAAQFSGVWRSTDGARTWRHSSSGIKFGVSRGDPTLGGSYLAFDGSDPTYRQRLLFAAIDDDITSNLSYGGLYVSNDGADSWQRIDLWATLPFARTNVNGECQSGKLDISTLLFSNGRPFVSTACGIFTTDDRSLRTGWAALPTPAGAPSPSAPRAPYADTFNSLLATDWAGTLFACHDSDTTLFESIDGARSWVPANAPPLGTGNCRGLAADPLNGTTSSPSRTVVEMTDYDGCPGKDDPLPPTCNYEVSTVKFANAAGAADERNPLGYPAEHESKCCGHPFVFTALRGDRPSSGDVAGVSYDVYAADDYHFAVFSRGVLAGPGGGFDGDVGPLPTWRIIGNDKMHVDTWAGVASPFHYAPSQGQCEVWLANDGGVFQNLSAPTLFGCAPEDGWARAMSGLHAFGSTSIVGARRPQSACDRQTEPCPALYVSSEHNDTWATSQARAGADWGIMDLTLGDSGSTFLDPALQYQFVTGRLGANCPLMLYYSTYGPQDPPEPGDQYNVEQGDRGNRTCVAPDFYPGNENQGELEPPGNAAFTQVRKVPSDGGGRLAEYVGASNVFLDGGSYETVLDRVFGAGGGPTIDSGWFELNPSHRFDFKQIAAVKTSGGQAHTFIYVLAGADGRGFVKGHIYRGEENPSRDFPWTDISGSPPDNIDQAGDMFVDPYNPDDLFVTDEKAQRIKETFDGGKTWQVDKPLTDIAEEHGAFKYNCVHTASFQGITANGCLLKDMHFVAGHPNIRVAVTLPGGVAFSRDFGHHWIDLDVTHNGTSFLGKRFPEPIQSPAGVFYDPTLNPQTGQPSLYVALRGAGVVRVDGPFNNLGGVEYSVRCESCRTLTVFDDTTGRFGSLDRYPDGRFRMTELVDLSGLKQLRFHYVIDGVRTQEQVTKLSGSQLDAGVVSLGDQCSADPLGKHPHCDGGNPPPEPAPPEIKEFQVPPPAAFPQGIARGPDDSMWFGLIQHSAIAHVDTSGAVTEFSLPDPDARPQDITAGPDGNLWFTERGNFCGAGNRIGRMTPSGDLTEYPLPAPCSQALGITPGPDGALWFSELQNNAIGRITVHGDITEFPLPTGSAGPATQGPQLIAAGPDGALWFTEVIGNRIGRVTTAGAFTEFSIPTARAGLSGIARGPDDGNLWFTEFFANRIGRITPSGAVTEFPIPTADSQPPVIATGPKSGALWFTEFNAGKIGRIATDGVISETTTPTSGSGPAGIAAGPLDSVWFTEVNPNRVATFADR
jgi:streptogramin lyase